MVETVRQACWWAGREAGKQARRELGSGRQKQVTGQIDRQRQEGK